MNWIKSDTESHKGDVLASVIKSILIKSPVLLLLTILSAQAQTTDWNARSPWRAWEGPSPIVEGNWASRRIEPFQIFDNVYYVGLHNVAVFLVETSDGLVLLDAGYPQTTDFILDSIRTLGFDASQIRYVFVSHAHGDHVGGAAKIREVTGARIGMSALDWEYLGQRGQVTNLPRDLVLNDGDLLQVGSTTFKFYISPGHTPGSLSIEYLVFDNGRPYRALSPGGLGFNFGPDWTQPYIDSLIRFKELGQFEVLLPNHPYMVPGGLFQLMAETDDDPLTIHPVVLGSEKINQFWDTVLELAYEKRASEQGSN